MRGSEQTIFIRGFEHDSYENLERAPGLNELIHDNLYAGGSLVASRAAKVWCHLLSGTSIRWGFRAQRLMMHAIACKVQYTP